jgi:cell division cycle 14
MEPETALEAWSKGLNTVVRDGMLKIFHPVLDLEVYLVTTNVMKEARLRFDNFSVMLVSDMEYVPFCLEFGPFNLAEIHRFVSEFKLLRTADPNAKILCVAEGVSSELTNAVFLLGCYMTMALGMSPEIVWHSFHAVSRYLVPYRDASRNGSDFDLDIIDCWLALKRASSLGWLLEFDMAEYAHYDNPLEGNLHAIIPGKLIAMQGPKPLPGHETYSDRGGQRSFAPAFFIDPFEDMGVRTVVRLNEREYDDAEFEQHGIRCVSLEFEDALPPPDVVIAFLHTMRTAKGAVAVHCRSGLGRTGTLCALHLMLSHGFGAREAIAWLRIVRPGSVVGEQVSPARPPARGA